MRKRNKRKRDASFDASPVSSVLLYLKFPHGWNSLYLLGHVKPEDSIVEGRCDTVYIDAGNIKASAETSIEALPLYIVLFLIFILFLSLGGDRKAIVLYIEADIVLAEPRKLGFEDIGIAIIYYIGAECTDSLRCISEKSALKIFKITEGIE